MSQKSHDARLPLSPCLSWSVGRAAPTMETLPQAVPELFKCVQLVFQHIFQFNLLLLIWFLNYQCHIESVIEDFRMQTKCFNKEGFPSWERLWQLQGEETTSSSSSHLNRRRTQLLLIFVLKALYGWGLHLHFYSTSVFRLAQYELF